MLCSLCLSSVSCRFGSDALPFVRFVCLQEFDGEMGVPLFNAVAILLCVTFSPLTLQAHMATTQTTTKTLTKEPTVFNIFSFGAQGLGQTNDTAAAQRTLDAAASCPTRPAIALLPANGTYKFGGGLHAIGHAYDGVTLLIEGKVIVPTPAWSTQV